MSKIDYLRAVLPPGTRYSLRLVKKLPHEENNLVRNKLYDSIDDMESEIEEYLGAQWNVYYATAGFGAGQNAKAENAVAKREFYIDVDCGDGKPYADKAVGMAALRDFTKKVKLPKPTIVDSGNGLHAHWVLETPIAIHDWLPIATALKERCVTEGFIVDGGCTADSVRVLRIPDTINFKNNTPVSLLTPVVYYTVEQIRAAVGVSVDIFAAAKKLQRQHPQGLSEVDKFYRESRTSKFETIWLRSQQGTGCAQIKNAIDNAETLEEPLWRAALSIAQYCEDREWAIHEISKDHPGYDPAQTEDKAAKTQGPYTCRAFEGIGPAHCESCSHKGKITSPIQLGSEVKQAEKQTVVETPQPDVTYEIPSMPSPYVRGERGGIYFRSPDLSETGETKLVMVYHSDIYAFNRQRHFEFGEVVWIRYHTRQDGIKEFMLPMSHIGALDKLRDGISKEGVVLFDMKQLKTFQDYLSKQIVELQFKEKAEDMHARFGWTPYDTFVVGEIEYTARGAKHAPAAHVIQDYVEWFKPRGTLDVWCKVADLYNEPAFDMHAAGVLAGFGSVLMHISPERGGVLNYYSKASGTGKTTILKLANSIFGDPLALMKDARDTHLSRVHRMGLLNGIVCTVDEMTNASAEDMSNSLYGSTQGRARDRMQAGTNAERTNKTTWKCISIWSSNASIEDKLAGIKADPQGELARCIEIYLQTPVPSDVLEAQKAFSLLNSNYGHAGATFLNYVVSNMDEVKKTWNTVRDKLYAKDNWTQVERYRLNMVICMVTAGIIAKSLALINYDIQRIARKLCDVVKASSKELRNSTTRAVESFAAFVNQNVNNILIINDAKVNGLNQAALSEPKGPLRIRYEPDTKSLFIVKRDFTKWCSESYLNAREMPTMFKNETGVELTTTKKRMGKGWKTDLGPVDVYVIPNASVVLGADLDEYANPDPT